jgi:enhanced entry protein LpnE
MNKFNNRSIQYFFVICLSLLMPICVYAKASDQSVRQILSEKLYVQAKQAYEQKYFSKALELLKESAKLNNNKALHALGWMYTYDSSFHEKNTDLAFDYMNRSVSLGNKEAVESLIYFKIQGFGKYTSTNDTLQARSIYEKKLLNTTSIQNRNEIFLALSGSYLFGKQELRNTKKAEEYASRLLTPPMNNGLRVSASATYATIAMNYMFGKNGAEKQPYKAFYWMKKAADLGNADACYNLSDMYFYGYGTAFNFSKAKQLSMQADQMGKVMGELGEVRGEHIFSKIFTPLFYISQR